MSTNEESRDYSFSDGELQLKAVELLAALTTDMPELAKRKVTADTLTAFSDLITALKNTKTDKYYAVKHKELILARDAARKTLIKEVKTLQSMATNAFGLQSPHIRQYSFSEMKLADDGDLISIIENAVQIAREDIEALTPEGDVEEVTASIQARITDFISAITAISQIDRDRAESKPKRLIAANTLYKELVRLCNIGKATFADTNPAKYNSYIIYGSPGAVGVRGTPANLRFDAGTNTLEWDAINNATSYNIALSKNNGETWQNDLTATTTSVSVPAEFEGVILYKVRGRNSTGFGEYSEVFERKLAA